MCAYLPTVLSPSLSLYLMLSVSLLLHFFMLSAGNLCAAAELRLSPISTASWFRLTSFHTHTHTHVPLSLSLCVCLLLSLSIIRHAMRASFVRTFNVIINSRPPYARVCLCMCLCACVCVCCYDFHVLQVNREPSYGLQVNSVLVIGRRPVYACIYKHKIRAQCTRRNFPHEQARGEREVRGAWRVVVTVFCCDCDCGFLSEPSIFGLCV